MSVAPSWFYFTAFSLAGGVAACDSPGRSTKSTWTLSSDAGVAFSLAASLASRVEKPKFDSCARWRRRIGIKPRGAGVAASVLLLRQSWRLRAHSHRPAVLACEVGLALVGGCSCSLCSARRCLGWCRGWCCDRASPVPALLSSTGNHRATAGASAAVKRFRGCTVPSFRWPPFSSQILHLGLCRFWLIFIDGHGHVITIVSTQLFEASLNLGRRRFD